MNERIRQLAEQATITKTELRNGWERKTYTHQEEVFDKEKFAELIVRECAEVIEICSHSNCYSGHEFSFAKESIKEHFGVEE